MGRHPSDLRVRAVQPRAVQNNRHAFQPGPVCGVHRPRIRVCRGLCRQIPVCRTGVANVGLAAAPACRSPAVGRGALPARLGCGADDGRRPSGVDEQGRAGRRRRGLRGLGIPRVECPGTLPVRLPCASVARGGTFGAGCAAPRGHRGRGIPYQAPFGRGTPADVEDRHADHAPPSALRGRDRKFRRRVRRRTGTLLRLGRASESRNSGRRMPPRRDSTNSCRPGRKLGQ